VSDTFRPQTITESVATELRKRIRSGACPPGSRLRQMDIAKQFGVSSTPIREVFAILEHEGLLVGSPHKGVTVFEPTIGDLRELYEIRIPLEALATERAVQAMSDDDVIGLEEILRDALLIGPDLEAEAARQTELNHRFHAAIYSQAGMPRLKRMIDDLRDASAAYVSLYLKFSAGSPAALEDHAAIVEACRDRAPERAGELMRAHLRHSLEMVSSGLSEPEE